MTSSSPAIGGIALGYARTKTTIFRLEAPNRTNGRVHVVITSAGASMPDPTRRRPTSPSAAEVLPLASWSGTPTRDEPMGDKSVQDLVVAIERCVGNEPERDEPVARVPLAIPLADVAHR